MSCTLPREARLVSGGQFAQVFSTRQSRGDALFRIHYAPSATPRLGMAVSRRVSKRAVERNRIRRQIRESFRLQRSHLRAMDYVVVARSAAADQDGKQLRMALDELWQRFSVNS